MQKIVIEEFCKDAFADLVMRLINATGGYATNLRVLGLHGCVWKNGKPSHPNQLRKAQDLRMPRWHRLMLDYVIQERLGRARTKRYFQKGGRLPFTPRSYFPRTP